MRRVHGVLALALAFSAGCDSSTEPEVVWVVSLGLLMPLSIVSTVVVPDTVVAGQQVPVIVNTVGSSSCTRPAGVVIVGAGTSHQTLTPLDSIAVRAAACTDDLAPRPHPAVLTFQQAGSATIRVQGYVIDQSGQRRVGGMEREIVVRP